MNQAFERNLGFISNEEQNILSDSDVAIAGADGDGGLISVELAGMGISELRLADPDPFELENINRQAVCNEDTIGVNKALAVSDYLKKINPNIKTTVLTDGVNKENIGDFLQGADLVIDETEFTLHALAVMVARQARAENIPNMTAFNIGFGTVSTTYHPQGPKLERRLGFTENQSIDEISATKVSIARWLPYLPNYGDLSVLQKVSKEEKSAPSIAPGVSIATSVGLTEAFLNLVQQGHGNHRRAPIYAPKAVVMDCMSIKADIIKFNRVSHYRYLSIVLLKNILKLNPKASY